MRYLISAIGFILCIIGIYYLELWVVNRSEENRIKLSLETIESSHRYTINDPDIAITLSDSLREISGLSYDPVSGQLLAIEDEHGLIYTVDKLTGKINNTREFAKDGDYEGIIYANKNIYILESNGHIFEYETDGKVKKYKTGLKKSFDFEGLTYLPDCNRLMLASKSSGPKTKSHLRKLFTFDLTQHTLDEEPPIILDCKDVGKELYKGKRGPTFSPSAITRDIN
ncbi:MAG: SdiA-regulated domain-containing protein, partial [Saprospiraceae bacterium]|nr:SdiA-regulated domain-containing protein [Saprospiraceae bacterium]